MRSVRLSILLALFLALGFASPSAVTAQAPYAEAPAAQAPAEVPADPAAATRTRVVQAGPTGLPERAAPPRTLRDHWHVFVAFALAWVLLFGYVVSLGRRWASVERELVARG